jgi:hypothetical protein
MTYDYDFYNAIFPFPWELYMPMLLCETYEQLQSAD